MHEFRTSHVTLSTLRAKVLVLGVGVAGLQAIATARRLADLLRRQDHADVVICLSHGGVRRDKDSDPWEGEDVELLQKVPGIDVVVGGHTHTPLPQPILVGGRPVVQAVKNVTVYVDEHCATDYLRRRVDERRRESMVATPSGKSEIATTFNAECRTSGRGQVLFTSRDFTSPCR